MDAILLPVNCDDRTLESLIDEALDLGMVPCSLMKGAFRIGFFNPDRIPSGWAKFGAVTKDAPKCAA